MDPRLLQYYNIELQHLREMGAEFAEQFPKIAARLGMNGLEVTDPYVERLIEGVGFLAARVHLKLDAEFPRFTQALLETVYPHYLAPTPSMLVAQCMPDPNEPGLASGVTVPRGSTMHGVMGGDDLTACEFRTAHDVTLWPLEIVSASYFSYAPDLPLNALPMAQRIKGGVRISLRTTAGVKFSQIAMDRLTMYLTGRNDVANAAVRAVPGVGPRRARAPRQGRLALARVPARHVDPARRLLRQRGAAAGDAALVPGVPAAAGVLFVSAAFPVRRDCRTAARAQAHRGPGDRRGHPVGPWRRESRERLVDASNIALFCTPAINLFPKRADRIHVTERHIRVSRRPRPDASAWTSKCTR